MSNFTSAFSGAAAGTIALGMVKLAIDHAAFESDLKNAKTTFERNLAEMGQAGQRVRNIGVAMAGVGIGVITQLTNLAAEAEVSNNRLRLTLENLGDSSETTYKRIGDAINKLSVDSAKDDERLADSYDKLARYLGSTEAGMYALQVATEAANGSGKELETVVQALIQGYNGQARGLRAIGVMLPENIKGMEALDFVMNKFTGSNERFAKSNTGAWQQAKVEWENAEEAAGTKLLPTITRLFTKLAEGAEWVSKLSDKQLGAITSTIMWGTAIGGVLAVAGQMTMWISSAVLLWEKYTIARKAATAADVAGGRGMAASFGAGSAAAAAIIYITALLVALKVAADRAADAAGRASGGSLIRTEKGLQTATEIAAETGDNFMDYARRVQGSGWNVFGPIGAGIAVHQVYEQSQERAEAATQTERERELANKARANRRAREAGMPDQYYSNAAAAYQSQSATAREQLTGLT